MKNNYQLKKLKKIELGPNESREAIYSLMLQPTLSGISFKHSTPLEIWSLT